MAIKIEDRIKETTLSTGTGAITLAGALTGFRSFSTVCVAGDTFDAAIVAVDTSGNPTGAWEVGTYTYSAINTIQRTTIISSSNSNLAVNFTAGTKHVYMTFSSAMAKAVAAATISGGAAPRPFGVNSALYTGLIFQDEFNGTVLDTTKWVDHIYYQTSNATTNYDVNGGNLRIWPQVDGTGSFFERHILTDGTFNFLYGFAECEAKLPIGAGVWPAFWLFNNDQHEIDIMEAYCGGSTGGWADASFHPTNYAGTVKTNNVTVVDTRKAGDFLTVPDLSLATHKYGVHWDANNIIFYFDGVQVGTPIPHTTLRVPMYVIFDILYGSASGNTNPPDGTRTATPQGNTNPFGINYCRIWGLA